MMYLIYDIKGIQQTITAVPRLRYMVGASSLIAQFDTVIAPDLTRNLDRKACTAGGGKGTIEVPDERHALQLREQLVRAAHRLGLDIRIGKHEVLSRAWEQAVLLPFVPSVFPGVPCGVSGLYPVTPADDPPAHRVIRQRFVASSANTNYRAHIPAAQESPDDLMEIARDGDVQGDLVGHQVLQRMAKELVLIKPGAGEVRSLADPASDGWRLNCRFMRNVSAEGSDLAAEAADGYQGQSALDHRNRWAVVVFDGNDIGKQITAAAGPDRKQGYSTLAFKDFMRSMSAGLNRLTLETVAKSLATVVRGWVEERNATGKGWENVTATESDGRKVIILPFRPLVAGGDDIQILAHPSHAFTLAAAIADHWRAGSTTVHDAGGKTLWTSTDGHLTTSGGLVFISNRYPIASAIDYAHRLLKLAKDSQRKPHDDGKSSPAAIDFEVITDGLLDNPDCRRARELVFRDPDLNGRTVKLTLRPYRIGADLDSVLQLARRIGDQEARHALAEVQAALRRPYHARLAAAWRMAKRHPLLSVLLAGPPIDKQPPPPQPQQVCGDQERKQADEAQELRDQVWTVPSCMDQPITTSLWDAILIVEETFRMQQETARA